MVTLAAGNVVLVPFPFTDLSQSKLRPALVLTGIVRDDWILCQITSSPFADPHAQVINDEDVRSGSLRIVSYARPGKLFTAHQSLVVDVIGALLPTSHQRITEAVIWLLRAGIES